MGKFSQMQIEIEDEERLERERLEEEEEKREIEARKRVSFKGVPKYYKNDEKVAFTPCGPITMENGYSSDDVRMINAKLGIPGWDYPEENVGSEKE